ncbi:hypothetical protein [Flavobacterium tyrosinilyticum]|uniref:hypothetical protein n=1 Tax=Flavobacterium tyrosinilyticum TaxID=1658740 RepID=UPI00202FB20B|nr:hypothetical protein [Flavobacterium tyrosinilyticum]MCM0666598.1 hypothetical protein [Flavobacterium tyrosinilyticum]
MTFPDLLKELNETAKERIKNPIIGAFVCSFLICNWQAIFILFWSDMSIEEKIEFINTKWKISLPIIFSLGYTLAIPLIMILMDYALMPMKRKRIANIYKNKGFTTDQKIVHAEKEFQLKSAESGNKDRQALLDQIKNLEESKAKIEETNSFIISNLNEKLEEVNKSFGESIEQKNLKISDLLNNYDIARNDFAKYKTLFAIMANLDQYEVDAIKQLGSDLISLISTTKIDEDSLRALKRMGLVVEKGTTYELTSLGKQMYSAIIEIGIE